MSYGYDLVEFQGEPDVEAYKLFILTLLFLPASTPLYFESLAQHLTPHPYHLGCDKVSSPTSNGPKYRFYKGCPYVSVDITTDDEFRERTPKFKEKMTKFLADPWAPWNEWKAELKSYYDRYIPMNLERLGGGELASHLYDIWNLDRRMWEIHMLGWETYGNGVVAFRDLCPELIGITYTDPLWAKLMSGFDNSLFQLNKGLTELGTKAMQLKLEDTFKLPDEQVLPAMEQSDAGREWLKAFHDFLYVQGHGWRMQRMLEYCTPSWIEKPSLAIPDIRRLMATGGVHAPDVQREWLVRQREEAEKEVLAKVPSADREWFEIVMRAAQANQVFSEDHDYWCEFKTFSLVRRAALEAGRRLVKTGIFEAPEDALMLLIEQLAIGVASPVRNAALVKPALKRNKEEWEHNVRLPFPSDEVPLFFGDPSYLPKLAKADACVDVLISEQVATPEEVGALCVGAAGAPGIVEGTARVIMSEHEWDQVQLGEILVTNMTAATWTPLFSIVRGVVADGGGMMAHAVIVGREYGIPAVVGCRDATQKIKTGDRIRVDGNLCRIDKL